MFALNKYQINYHYHNSENVWKAWEKAAPIDRVKGPDLFSQIHQKQQEPFQEEQQSEEMTRISENCQN